MASAYSRGRTVLQQWCEGFLLRFSVDLLLEEWNEDFRPDVDDSPHPEGRRARNGSRNVRNAPLKSRGKCKDPWRRWLNTNGARTHPLDPSAHDPVAVHEGWLVCIHVRTVYFVAGSWREEIVHSFKHKFASASRSPSWYHRVPTATSVVPGRLPTGRHDESTAESLAHVGTSERTRRLRLNRAFKIKNRRHGRGKEPSFRRSFEGLDRVRRWSSSDETRSPLQGKPSEYEGHADS